MALLSVIRRWHLRDKIWIREIARLRIPVTLITSSGGA